MRERRSIYIIDDVLFEERLKPYIGPKKMEQGLTL